MGEKKIGIVARLFWSENGWKGFDKEQSKKIVDKILNSDPEKLSVL